MYFSTGGSTSSIGHSVEYRFDWGDGSLSGWGGPNASHSWNSTGFFLITAQARCATHTSVVSGWSSGLIITISGTAVEKFETHTIPSDFQIFQNYPNPFNAETCITFHLPHSCDVKVEVFSINGSLLSTLVSGSLPAGVFQVRWNGRSNTGKPVPSGSYVYRLKAGDFISVKRMLYLK